MKRLGSFREYCDALREIGELVDVERPVDWNLEMGAIARRVNELGAPVPLFHHVKGVPAGYRALGAPAGISATPGRYFARIAISLGLPPESSGVEIVRALLDARAKAHIAPRSVDTGPCKDVKLIGDAVDLARFPVPLIHNGDGGRYIGTYATIVARTPDGSWTNWSNARVMMVDGRRMSGIVNPFQHLGMIHKMWADIGKDMPFAMCLGVEPAISFVSGMPLPAHVDESGYVGAYFGEPVDVVACESVPLDVPATSEIVVEGYLSATQTVVEGPMGEYAGYLWTGDGEQRPVYNVTAITHRQDPILPFVVAGEPIEEDHTVQGIPSAAEALGVLRDAAIPATMAWVTLEAANHLLVVTLPADWRAQTGLERDALLEKIGRTIFEGFKFGANLPKIMVFNDDIDATNLREVMWAFATRVRPVTGEKFFNNEAIVPLVAFLTSGEKHSFHSTKVVYDGLTPDEWEQRLPARTAFRYNYPEELQRSIVENWHQYGFR